MEMLQIMSLSLTATWLYLSVATVGAQTTAEILSTQTPTEPPFGLNVGHVSSSTSSVEIKWAVPNGYEIKEYYIQAMRKESEAVVKSPIHPSNTSQYEITDLMTNSKYEICMYATVNNHSREDFNYIECIDTFTIPLIRNDSLIVLFCVFGYILLMILIGYFCWRRAHKQKEAEMEDDEENEQLNENGDQSKPILLVSPPQTDRPRSVIEDDADIPYITPTWDQIEKDNKLRARTGHQPE